MKTFLIIPFLLLFTLKAQAFIALTRAQENELKNILNEVWGAPIKFTPDLLKGDVVAVGNAQSENNLQTMGTKVVGLHPRTCAAGLRKISRYEQYSKHMSFLKESNYSDKDQKIFFLIDHTVLPYPMVLRFKIPRITSPGDYSFTFEDGIFKGLIGKISIRSIGNRCLYFMKVDWKGPSTKIPNIVVSAFAQTLSKLGLEHLIRVSTF